MRIMYMATTYWDKIKTAFTSIVAGGNNISVSSTTSASNTGFFFILIIFFASMFYVFNQTMFSIGYVLLAIIYCGAWFYMLYTAYNKGVLSKIQPINIFTNYLMIPFLLIILLFVFTFLYLFLKKTDLPDLQINGISIFGSALLVGSIYKFINYAVDNKIITKDVYTKIQSWTIIATFACIIIYNLISVTEIMSSVFTRTKQMNSYDLGISAKRYSAFSGYNTLFYISTFASLFIVQDAILTTEKMATATTATYPENPKIIMGAFVVALGTSITNYFVSADIVKNLEADSTKEIKKTPDQKAMDVSNEKAQGQNVVKSAYYWFLNLFKDPSIMA